MKTYVSHKKVKATPMTRKEAELKGLVRDKEPDSVADEDGYKVVYKDGYESWSPKEAFEGGYTEEGTTVAKEFFDFGQALFFLKQGYKVARKGWNGKGMFLFLVQGSTFKVNRPPLLGIYEEGTEVNYHAHIDMKTVDDTVVPWLASQTDMLSEDWTIVD